MPRVGLVSELKADELRLTPSYVSAARVMHLRQGIIQGYNHFCRRLPSSPPSKTLTLLGSETRDRIHIHARLANFGQSNSAQTYPRHSDWMNEPIPEVKGGHDVIMA